MKTSEKLNLLADRLENEVKDVNFDLYTIKSFSACGTVACVVGWAREWGMVPDTNRCDSGYSGDFMSGIGTTQEETLYICEPSRYEMEPRTRVNAITHVRKIAAKYQDQEIEEQHNSNQREKQNERAKRKHETLECSASTADRIS